MLLYFRWRVIEEVGPVWFTLFSNRAFLQPLSLTFKVVQARKLRWKLRKIFWQSGLLQRNNLLKENMEVLLTQTNDRKVSCNLPRYERRASFVWSLSASCYSTMSPWGKAEITFSNASVTAYQFIIALYAYSRKTSVPWQTHEEIICLSSRLGTSLCISWVSFLKNFFHFKWCFCAPSHCHWWHFLQNCWENIHKVWRHHSLGQPGSIQRPLNGPGPWEALRLAAGWKHEPVVSEFDWFVDLLVGPMFSHWNWKKMVLCDGVPEALFLISFTTSWLLTLQFCSSTPLSNFSCRPWPSAAQRPTELLPL